MKVISDVSIWNIWKSESERVWLRKWSVKWAFEIFERVKVKEWESLAETESVLFQTPLSSSAASAATSLQQHLAKYHFHIENVEKYLHLAYF